MKPSRSVVVTIERPVVAEDWSRIRIGGAQDSATIIYRHAEARRATMRKRLREVLSR